jgi:oligopeptide/dipeptide ABC transporter ATP-binding protein
VLEIENLKVGFRFLTGDVAVLRGVDLSLGKNEVLALAGESGCGKTLTALSVVKLLPHNAGVRTGRIRLSGQDLVRLPEPEMQRIRGRRVGMIFQDPASYLNPVFTVGNQVVEAVKEKILPAEKKALVYASFQEVGLQKSHYSQYPHQLSGGMQQRVLIALALINHPDLLIADEPTTALDVTTALQIMELLKNLMEKYGLAVLFITHDLALARFFADRIAIMYAGKIVELAESKTLFDHPAHPYTESLIACLPERYSRHEKIRTIPGGVPDFRQLPPGCAFHPRCRYRKEICSTHQPGPLIHNGALVRCFRYGDIVEN